MYCESMWVEGKGKIVETIIKQRKKRIEEEKKGQRKWGRRIQRLI